MPSFPIIAGAWWFLAQSAPEATGSSVLVTLAAVVGLFTGISAIVVAWRNAQSSAKKDYVQGNLDSLAAVNERLEQENEKLRKRDEQNRARIIVLEQEREEDRQQITSLENDLAQVRQECDECLSRVEQLEKNQ